MTLVAFWYCESSANNMGQTASSIILEGYNLVATLERSSQRPQPSYRRRVDNLARILANMPEARSSLRRRELVEQCARLQRTIGHASATIIYLFEQKERLQEQVFQLQDRLRLLQQPPVLPTYEEAMALSVPVEVDDDAVVIEPEPEQMLDEPQPPQAHSSVNVQRVFLTRPPVRDLSQPPAAHQASIIRRPF